MMKMWACAYQYEEDVFYDFEKGEDTYGIESTCLLPTKELAEQLIEDILCDDYVPVEIDIINYKENGVMIFTVGRVDRWFWGNDIDCYNEEEEI